LANSEEAVQLRRRARRRLVGAIALVVFAVIVLPIVFDKEPKPISQDIVIQIPSQNSGRFNTKVVPAAPEPAKSETAGKAAETKAAAVAKTGAPAAQRAQADAEALRAQAALQGESYVVPLGAFLNQANVKTLQAKVTVAGFKSYSEIQKVARGEQIRVRAGPFPSREAAERAREQLQATGLTVGPVTKL